MVDSVLNGEEFAVSFSHREVAVWGGLALFRQMLDSIGFLEEAADRGLPEPKSNRGYAPTQLIERFIVSIWCGACRFAHAETVRMDKHPGRLFGWTRAAPWGELFPTVAQSWCQPDTGDPTLHLCRAGAQNPLTPPTPSKASTAARARASATKDTSRMTRQPPS